MKIVWNGSDTYVLADEAVERGCDFDGEFLYAQVHKFQAFEVEEVDVSTLPLDDEGNPDFNGILGCMDGQFYRAKE